MEILLALAFILIGYLLGSVPWSLLLVRWKLGQDLRTIGSGNLGANNVLRTGHKGLAALTLFLDALKGALPYALADALANPQVAALAGFAAFLGHLYPVWLRGKGGKGVATAFGVMLVAAPALGLVLAGLWLAAALIFRISSLAALIACAFALLATPIAAKTALIEPTLGLLAPVLAIWVIWRHRSNINRLRQGLEPKIGNLNKLK